MTKEETAAWMGYDTVEQMDAEHDELHRKLCDWIKLPSWSMRQAKGEKLTPGEQMMACYEEDAVLNVQRFRQMARRHGCAV